MRPRKSSGQAIGLHIVTQNRLLTVIALLTKFPVKNFTVEHTALKALIEMRLKWIKLPEPRRPRLIAGLLRMQQVLTNCLSITADTASNLGDAESLTG
jgi:hypothetical protein